MNFKPVANEGVIDSVGRVYLAKSVREKIQAEEGDKVEVLADEKNKAVLIKLEDKGE